MTTPHKPPEYDSKAFNCPLCGAFADQEWLLTQGDNKQDAQIRRGAVKFQKISRVEFAQCNHCKQHTVWLDKKMIYPLTGNVSLPNVDMPDDVKEDYNEARDIVNISPRGAAALLRLSVQKLCKQLGEKGDNINDDIASLVKKGLPERMQKALDNVRVIGNNAVHPGQIDLKDDFETAYKLFGFINVIVDIMISQPKQIDEFYDYKVPDNIKDKIDKRDGKK